MKRRDFLRNSIAAGITAAFSGNLIAQNAVSDEGLYDLAAIKGGEPEAMFDKAIQSLGGIERFVKKGQKVVVKPNIGWDASPERAANTNPKLVGRVVQRCLEAGAREVMVFDHTCNNWVKCYKNSMIEKYVKDSGGKIVPGNDEKYYQDVEVPGGKSLKNTSVHEAILESDVFINIPVLKHHSSTKISVGMKNLMGIVYDRGWWHKNDLHQCVADFGTYRIPDLTIVDAYNVMKRNGPRGVSTADVVNMQSQIISADIVAADAAAAKLFGHEPEEIPHIVHADTMGLGIKDLSKLKIARLRA